MICDANASAPSSLASVACQTRHGKIASRYLPLLADSRRRHAPASGARAARKRYGKQMAYASGFACRRRVAQSSGRSHKPSVDGGLRARKLRCGMVGASRGQKAKRVRVFVKCVTRPALNPEQIAGTLVRRRVRLRVCATRRACCRRGRLALSRHRARYACVAAGRASVRERPL